MYDLKIPDVTVCDSDNESDLSENQPTINSQQADNVHNDDVYDMDTDEDVKSKSKVKSWIKLEWIIITNKSIICYNFFLLFY